MSSSPSARPDPGSGDVPTCFRHPHREAHVRCNRCERRICPDCMRDAAVGFHCVECVAQGNKGVREARTTFGGKVTRGPYVTWILLALMAVGFVAQMATSPNPVAPQESPLVRSFAMWGGGVVAMGEWYRLITAAFLHGSFVHILLNGYVTYALGPQLERWLGHARFLGLWGLSAIGGSVLTLLVDPGQSAIGASGALFGMFGAIFLIGRRLRLNTQFVVILLVANLAVTFLVPGISWTAHIGGLVSGLALGGAYAHLNPGTTPRARTLAHTGAALAYAALLVALAAGAVLYWAG